jgi:hypothetical protein
VTVVEIAIVEAGVVAARDAPANASATRQTRPTRRRRVTVG